MVPIREPKTYSILLADDLTLVREGLAALCNAQPHFKVMGQCSEGAVALRIRDVTDVLKIPRETTNALMQYLKRKDLVQKISDEFAAPYSLTDKGHSALAEMTRRHAA